MPNVIVLYVGQFLPSGQEDKPGNWHDLSKWPTPGEAFERLDVFRAAFEDREDKAGLPEGYHVVKRTIKDEIVTDPRVLAEETSKAS